MVQQEFKGPVGQVAAGNIINPPSRQWPEHLAQSDDQLRGCPRCSHLTWRDDRACFHCGYDLVAHDKDVAIAAWEEADQERRLRAMKASVVLCLGAMGLWGLELLLPEAISELMRVGKWILVFGATCALFASSKGQRPEQL